MRLAAAVSAMALLGAAAAEARPIAFAAEAPKTGALVLPLAAAADLETRGAALDPATRAAVARALTAAKFDYKADSSLTLRGLGAYDEILVLGAAEADTAAELRKLGAAAAKATAKSERPAAFIASGLAEPAQIAVGAELRSYQFAGYKAEAKRDAGLDQPFVVVTPDAAAARQAWERRLDALTGGVSFTRDLVTEPANVLYPEEFVARTRAAFKDVAGVSIEVLDVPAMEKLGMNAILSVGAGSARPPRMMIVEYRGPGASGAPIVLAGKGITFDSGGTSLKSRTGMWEMKTDMAGAATVMGATLSLARSRAPVHVVAVAALAENMPGGSAARPGDVMKAYNGKSIERLNTDAEGRIVLADAVSYADRKYEPAAIIDLATLTGAVGTAIGDEYAGLFSRHEGLAAQVQAAAETADEPVWRLPLHPSYAKDLESPIADIRDVKEGGLAGASLGAHFIGFFVRPETPWAHLDIAYTAWADADKPLGPKGAQGYGVMLLDELVRGFDAAAAKRK
jgi:leucyl aminopeptidase